jgi:type II restriction/modification system DNA methylase subunit YeeA
VALGWNEIKDRAVRFSKEWERAFNEEAEAQSFLVEFFNVFGISSRKVATFEHKVKKLDEHDGYIDLLWKGTLLVEMKSRGKNLDRAYQQAGEYMDGLKQFELPKYVLLSDFENFRLYDLDENTQTDFQLKDFVKNIQLFGFIAGYQKRIYKAEDPVNIEAAYLMGKLHDALKDAGYTGHELEKYLVRLLFCLFAEDTTIFEKNAFKEYIEDKTNEDGTDLGMHIAQLFQVLNTPNKNRQKTLDESLSIFPYVNGQLFAEQLSFASFNSKMRLTLLECCQLDWSKISPAIFGSMFQSVMDINQRRNLGAHYTSEKNILKLIKPLFLDKLWQEFEAVKNNSNKLKAFHGKIATQRFLDPACGCGNFLVITYRELRLLELAILKQQQNGQQVIDLESLILCNVDKFYGIEYEEFPAQIAQVALWLVDHQMNMLFSLEFGEYFVRLPLHHSAKIVHGNALRIDWDDLLISEKTVSIYAKEANVIQVSEHDLTYGKVNLFAEKINITDKPVDDSNQGIKFNYILGNPPFIGKQVQSTTQKSDMDLVLNDVKGSGVLDYVTAWYIKAAQYLLIHNIEDRYNENKTCVAFVSTNSISQGEQVGVLWNEMFNRYKIKIHFAHRTFKWGNEAKANAAVHVVIIGFSNFDISEKLIYEYDDIKGEPHELKVKNINPYLIEGKDSLISKKSNPICNVQLMLKGSMPNDGGYFILNQQEKDELLSKYPEAAKFVKLFLGANEFINGIKRYCLWLVDAKPDEIKSIPPIYERVKNVRINRLNSQRGTTIKDAEKPMLFGEIRQPKTDYLAVPEVSSERRKYIPIGYLKSEIIISNKIYTISNATLFSFGVLSSVMHMTWVNYVCGRMKSDYSYSTSIVYNNYPWPETPTDKQKEAIEKAAQKVLDVRLMFPDNCLADLYDPLTMPSALIKAHQELDKSVDQAYRPQPFTNGTKRIEFLFELYEKYTAGLFAGEIKKKRR